MAQCAALTGSTGHHFPSDAVDLTHPFWAARVWLSKCMQLLRALTLLLLASSPALAQTTGSRRVSGTVFDSIGRVALSGAVVELAMVDPDAGRNTANRSTLPSFAVITDSAGRFEIAGLPSGIFAVGFQHNVLSGLGIESPISVLDLRADSVAKLDLAIPGGRFVRDKACGSQPEGLLAGFIVSARDGAPVTNAAVVVSWDELIAAERRLSQSHHESKATPDSTGRFSICGLPPESPLTLSVSADGYRALETEITLPPYAVLYHELKLAAADSTRGTASIRVRAVDDSGRAMTNGRAMIVSLGRRASIDSGTATISNLPRGTWIVDVRAIGYQPVAILVDAETEPLTTRTVRMDRLPQLLGPVSIVGKANAVERRVLEDIDQRMRAGNGTLIGSDNLSLRNAVYASDGVRFARGFRVSGSNVQGRPYSQGISIKSCESKDLVPVGEKSIAVYLDGVRVPFGLQGVNDLIRPQEILAIEAYPDVISAPGLWKTNDACAVIAFWTKR